jgi:hypothetical protein
VCLWGDPHGRQPLDGPQFHKKTPEGVVVSAPLTWRRDHSRHHVGVAEGLVYIVHKVAGTQRWHVSRNGEPIGDVVGGSVGAAKRIAQVDYEHCHV